MAEVQTNYIYYGGGLLAFVVLIALVLISTYLKKRQLAKKKAKQQKLNQIRDTVNTSRNGPNYKSYAKRVVSDDEELRVMEPETFVVSPVPENFISSDIQYSYNHLDFRRIAQLYMCPKNKVCTWCARCKCREPCSFCKMMCKDCDFCPEHREKETRTNACETCRIQRDRGAGYVRCSKHLDCNNCENKYENGKVVPCDKC